VIDCNDGKTERNATKSQKWETKTTRIIKTSRDCISGT